MTGERHTVRDILHDLCDHSVCPFHGQDSLGHQVTHSVCDLFIVYVCIKVNINSQDHLFLSYETLSYYTYSLPFYLLFTHLPLPILAPINGISRTEVLTSTKWNFPDSLVYMVGCRVWSRRESLTGREGRD